jgi:hypothetical protein
VIVVVTGGRDFDDRQMLYDALDLLHQEPSGPITLIRNGGMTGADALSSRWAYDHKVDTDCFGAKWGRYGGQGGPMRNMEMLDATPSPDLVVAFPGGRGTAGCVRSARARGIDVWEVS